MNKSSTFSEKGTFQQKNATSFEMDMGLPLRDILRNKFLF